MESVWVQLLVGLLAVCGPFVGAGLGAVLLAWTPVRSPSDDVRQRPAEAPVGGPAAGRMR
jgi:hypothetical protein